MVGGHVALAHGRGIPRPLPHLPARRRPRRHRADQWRSEGGTCAAPARPRPRQPSEVRTGRADHPRRTPPRAHPGLAAGDRDRELRVRSEEHTSELQSRFDLVCRLLLEKKKDRLEYLIKFPTAKMNKM